MIFHIFIIYINMANFTDQNQIITNTAYEFPCEYNDIYIDGLKEGEILVSYNPYLLQNSNGLVIGIDSRFSRFYVMDKNRIIIKELDLTWINSCDTKINTHIHQYTKNSSFLILLIMLIFIFIINIIRRKK